MVWNLVIEFRGNDEFSDRVLVAQGGGAHDTTQYLAHRNTNFQKMCTIMEHCPIFGHIFKPRKRGAILRPHPHLIFLSNGYSKALTMAINKASLACCSFGRSSYATKHGCSFFSGSLIGPNFHPDLSFSSIQLL